MGEQALVKGKKSGMLKPEERKETALRLTNRTELTVWRTMAQNVKANPFLAGKSGSADFNFLVGELIKYGKPGAKIEIGVVNYLKEGTGEVFITTGTGPYAKMYKVRAEAGSITDVTKMPACCDPLAYSRLYRGEELSHKNEFEVLRNYYGKLISRNTNKQLLNDKGARIVSSPTLMNDGIFANVTPTKLEGGKVKFDIVVPFERNEKARAAAQPENGVYRVSFDGDKFSAVPLPMTMNDKEVQAAMEAYAKIFRGEGLKPQDKPKLESKEMLSLLRNYAIYTSERQMQDGSPKPEGFDKLYSLVMSGAPTPKVGGEINISKEGRLKLDLTVMGTEGMYIKMDAQKGEMSIGPL